MCGRYIWIYELTELICNIFAQRDSLGRGGKGFMANVEQTLPLSPSLFS